MGKNKRRNNKAFGNTTSKTVGEPPDGCQHYETVGDMPWDSQKYVLL